MHFSGPAARTTPSLRSFRNLGGIGTRPFSSILYSNSPKNMLLPFAAYLFLTTIYPFLPISTILHIIFYFVNPFLHNFLEIYGKFNIKPIFESNLPCFLVGK